MDQPLPIDIVNGNLIELYLAVLFTFIIGIAIITFCIFYLRKLFNQKLEMQRLESEHRKNLLQASLQAQEKERARLASDLHDDVGASLAMIKLYATHLKENTNESITQVPSQKIADLIDQTVINIRQLSQNLLPIHLEQFGFVKAIEEKCREVNDSNQGIQARFRGDKSIQLPAEKSLHLYRIVQELLNNTLKHAEATKISLAFELESGQVNFTYQDNGKGFLLPEIEKMPIEKKSLGLKTIASRVELLNATITYQSAHRQGLLVKIKFTI